jgi:hypothetical protein
MFFPFSKKMDIMARFADMTGLGKLVSINVDKKYCMYMQ